MFVFGPDLKQYFNLDSSANDILFLIYALLDDARI